eukprot:TRINITY_DN986_c0_g2_i2.p1 TRINITY_DN986_c0_g2~~TRINITY_DN986_c0_g2_i2.p1  ORF type:complete len:500 (+),score=216.27 TRINITY_DN986_c0_g2_i2:290-1789(+)
MLKRSILSNPSAGAHPPSPLSSRISTTSFSSSSSSNGPVYYPGETGSSSSSSSGPGSREKDSPPPSKGFGSRLGSNSVDGLAIRKRREIHEREMEVYDGPSLPDQLKSCPSLILDYRRELTRLREVQTQAQASISHLDVLADVIKYVGQHEPTDPLINSAVTCWTSKFGDRIESKSSRDSKNKAIDKSFKKKPQYNLIACFTSGAQPTALDPLWRLLDDTAPKSALKANHARHIRQQATKYMRMIVNTLNQLQIPLEKPSNQSAMSDFLTLTGEQDSTPTTAAQFVSLWNDNGIKTAFLASSFDPATSDRINTVFQNIGRILGDDYTPTPEDQTFKYRTSFGVREGMLKIGELDCMLVGLDVLGQRQTKFISTFSHADEMIFIINMVSDLATIRRSVDSFLSFQAHPSVRRIPIILILTGVESFISSNRDISFHFPDFNGKPSEAVNYLTNMMIRAKSEYLGKVYVCQCEDFSKKTFTFLSRTLREIGQMGMEGLNVIN